MKEVLFMFGKNSYKRDRFCVKVVIACLILAAPCIAVDYEIVVLGTTADWGNALGINDSGHIIGDYRPESGYYHACLWIDGVSHDLGTLGGTHSSASGINNSGQVVGWSYIPSSWLVSRAFLWTDGVMHDLGTLGGGYSSASDINNSGQVVGWALTADLTDDGEYHAFLWTDGVMQDLGTLGGKHSYANGINNSGQVVGYSMTSDGEQHAFLWTDGVMQDLGTLGGSFSLAKGINDLGQIAGYSDTNSGEQHAFLWTDGVMQDLGTLGGSVSIVQDLNNSGQVVGYSWTADGEVHAFLWTDGVMHELAARNGSHAYARGINNSGQVVGYAQGDSGYYSCMWIPCTDTPVSITGLSADPLAVQLGDAVSFETDITNGCGKIDVLWDYGDGQNDTQFDVPSPGTVTATHTYTSVGEYPVVLSVTDNSHTVRDNVVVVVYNPIEIVAGSLIANPLTVELGNSITFAADITGGYGPIDVLWDYDDGHSDSQSDVPSPGTVTATHTYDVVGVDTVVLSATDFSGSVVDGILVVVYDPTGGFATGAGLIDSPPGAYKPDSSLTGKANFAFISKYQKGAAVPTGNTTFIFRSGDLYLRSTSFDWMVITGSNYARFKGTGTINGSGEYRFMLWAGDDNPDTFRIKIWTENVEGNETIIYDNGFDQEIMGGNIIIHD